jgi:hypothetical protein
MVTYAHISRKPPEVTQRWRLEEPELTIGHTAVQAHNLVLVKFTAVTVVTLILPPGEYIAFGNVALINSDDEDQNFDVKLRVSGPGSIPFRTIGEADVRLAGRHKANRTCVPVQGGFKAAGKASSTVTLLCATYSGIASSAALAAIKLDHLESH